jgi:hypothetical protein
MSALRDYVDEGPVGKRRLPVLTQPDDDDDEDEVDEDEDEATCADGDADDEGLDATSAGRPAELEDAGDFDGGE